MSQRWTIKGLATGTTWTFVRNPRVMGNIHPPRATIGERVPWGLVSTRRAGTKAFGWEFRGRLHTQAEYDNFLLWRNLGRSLVTDHLGRKHIVIPTAFEPTPMPRTGTGNEWLFDYTFKTMYLERQA